MYIYAHAYAYAPGCVQCPQEKASSLGKICGFHMLGNIEADALFMFLKAVLIGLSMFFNLNFKKITDSHHYHPG
jgi:hypothetical protein